MPSGGILLVRVDLGQHCPWPLNADPLGGVEMKWHSLLSSARTFAGFSLATLEGIAAIFIVVWPIMCVLRYAFDLPQVPPDRGFTFSLMLFAYAALLRRDWARTRFLILHVIPFAFFGLLAIVSLKLVVNHRAPSATLAVFVLSGLALALLAFAESRNRKQPPNHASRHSA